MPRAPVEAAWQWLVADRGFASLGGTTAEYAVSVVMRRYRQKFAQMSDRYMQDRVKDIDDIEKRLLRIRPD